MKAASIAGMRPTDRPEVSDHPTAILLPSFLTWRRILAAQFSLVIEHRNLIHIPPADGGQPIPFYFTILQQSAHGLRRLAEVFSNPFHGYCLMRE